MGTELNCLFCGKAFEPTCHISRQKYCSRECCVKYNNAKRYFGGLVDTCPECGEHIEQTGERGRRRRFCSDRCRIVYGRKKQQEKRRSEEHPNPICQNCGVDFEPEWGGRPRRFCSDACRVEWWKEYHKANPTEEPAEHKCVCCGREFRSDRWHGGEYCSRDCYLKVMAQTHVQVTCAWCGKEFTAPASAGRKYCSLDCVSAARHQPGKCQRASHRIFYKNPEEWREQIREASRKAGSPSKRGRRVWLVCGATSMYLGLDGLLGTIQYRLNRNPYDGGIYVFCDSTGMMLKYLEWDGSGFCLGKRRAQSGSYPWPPSEAGAVIEITEKEFEFLKGKSIVACRTKKPPDSTNENAVKA